MSGEAREHSTYVQLVAGGGFFACCRSCGCDGFPNRRTLITAEADARLHGTLDHLYTRDYLLLYEDGAELVGWPRR